MPLKGVVYLPKLVYHVWCMRLKIGDYTGTRIFIALVECIIGHSLM